MCSWPQKRCLNRAVHGKTWQKVIFLKLDKSIKDFSLFILLSLKYKCDPHQTKIVLFVWLRSYHVVLGNSQCAPLLLPCNDANTNKEPSLSDFTRVGFQGNIKLFVKLAPHQLTHTRFHSRIAHRLHFIHNVILKYEAHRSHETYIVPCVRSEGRLWWWLIGLCVSPG